jgi:hypothetical protein
MRSFMSRGKMIEGMIIEYTNTIEQIFDLI